MSRWVGQPLPRREDLPLLTGRGRFVDDVQVANPLHVAFARSPWAHAEIRSVDLSAALASPGVAAALAGAELPGLTDPFAAGITHELGYYAMAVDRARYAGEPVAAIAAESRYLAEDAAELVVADYEPLDAVVTVEDALDPAKPVLHESVGSNVVVDRTLRYGDPDGAFARADLVVTETLRWERYSSTPIETYGIVADYEPASGRLTMWANFMGPMTLLPVLAKALRMPEAQLRVIVPKDIGGSFGIKSSLFPYMVVLALLAMRTGRPVKWIEDRAEHLIASCHQPDRVGTRELALTKDGEIIGLRAHVVDNLGAYVRAPEPATTFRPLGNYVGPYRVQNVELHLRDVVSNKVPTGPNRGYGCHQVYLETERTLDEAALQLGLDPAEIRRRNLIPADAFPYETPSGGLYDSGDYPRVLELALETAGYEELRALQADAREEGRLVGIGIGLAVDPSISNMGYITVALPPEVRQAPGYNPKSGAADWAQVRVNASGKVVVTMGTAPQGQGHETAVAQIVADELGLTPDDVADGRRVRQPHLGLVGLVGLVLVAVLRDRRGRGPALGRRRQAADPRDRREPARGERRRPRARRRPGAREGLARPGRLAAAGRRRRALGPTRPAGGDERRDPGVRGLPHPDLGAADRRRPRQLLARVRLHRRRDRGRGRPGHLAA